MRLEFETNVITIPPAVCGTLHETPIAGTDDFETTLNNGIAAAKNGEREVAREFLTEAAEMSAFSEEAWMGLASISEYPEELVAFLTNVLTINPENARAKDWLAET